MGCAGCLSYCQGGQDKQVSEEVQRAEFSKRRNQWGNQGRKKEPGTEMSVSGQKGGTKKTESGASTRRKDLQKLWLGNECWNQLQVLEATKQKGERKHMMHWRCLEGNTELNLKWRALSLVIQLAILVMSFEQFCLCSSMCVCMEWALFLFTDVCSSHVPFFTCILAASTLLRQLLEVI